MNPVRTLAFVLGIKYAWAISPVRSALEAIVIQQLSLAYGTGGKTVASGTVGGESVSFFIPGNFTPDTLAELARSLYSDIEDFTDDDLRAYALVKEPDSFRLSMNLNP